jgi:hypothetical protein
LRFHSHLPWVAILPHPSRKGRGSAGGPIPARAGEPSQDGKQGHGRRAYPRSRGGTSVRSSPVTARRPLGKLWYRHSLKSLFIPISLISFSSHHRPVSFTQTL